jgi:type IV pilus assembly protein PilN
MAPLIRINLLPVRQGRKREISRQFLVLCGGVLILILVGNYLLYDHVNSEYERNVTRLSQTQARIAELEKVIGEVNNLNARKKEVEDKLKVLNGLRKGRTGPVKLLDALSIAVPKKVWLSEFDEKSNVARIHGTALNHDDVAELMRSLANVVWTPKGMGRLVEQRRDAKTSRVELLGAGNTIEDFAVADVGAFFTNIELRHTEQRETKSASGASKLVDFEIGLSVNYAI